MVTCGDDKKEDSGILRSAPDFYPADAGEACAQAAAGEAWRYQLKLDGYRIQGMKEGAGVRLLSRRRNDSTKKFAPVAAGVSKLKANSAILDGKLVAVDDARQSS